MTSAPGPSPRPVPRPVRRSAARRVAAAGAAAVLAATISAPLAACGVRLETPAPVAPSADAAEQLRDRSARQAADLARLADAAVPTADDAAAAVLARVADASMAHVTALGGVYEPFPGATASPTASPTATSATPTPPPDAATVLVALRAAAEAARADAAAAPDPAMAHLLTAVAIARAVLVDALSSVVDGTTADLGDVPVPDSLPGGMDAQAAAVLVQSEDAVGMAWEVAAARSDGEARDRAAQRAGQHRDRAEAWAVAAGFAGTGADPRRSAYDLPDGLTAADATAESVATALGELEARLGADYADLAATLAPGGRDAVLDAALEAYRRAAGLGAAIGDLPGVDADQAS